MARTDIPDPLTSASPSPTATGESSVLAFLAAAAKVAPVDAVDAMEEPRHAATERRPTFACMRALVRGAVALGTHALCEAAVFVQPRTAMEARRARALYGDQVEKLAARGGDSDALRDKRAQLTRAIAVLDALEQLLAWTERRAGRERSAAARVGELAHAVVAAANVPFAWQLQLALHALGACHRL